MRFTLLATGEEVTPFEFGVLLLQQGYEDNPDHADPGTMNKEEITKYGLRVLMDMVVDGEAEITG